MKIQEVVLKEELSDKELLVSSKVGVVKNAKDTARIIHLLGEVAPLDMFGLRHLKRVRKRPAEESDGSSSSNVEMYICPSSAIDDISDDILGYFESPLRNLEVCQVKPRDRVDRDAFGRYWPVIFRPTELSEEQEKGLSDEVQCDMVGHLLSLRRTAISSSAASLGAIIVNPANNKVVMDAERAMQFLTRQQEQIDGVEKGEASAESRIAAHPLYTPIMMCIEGVAAIVRGEMSPTTSCSDSTCGGSGSCSGENINISESKSDGDDCRTIKVQSSTPETDQYVCTGLDAYLAKEPTVMETMALVHSRIRRVVFLAPDTKQGALGSVYSLHRIASLNHRFRVFQGLEEDRDS